MWEYLVKRIRPGRPQVESTDVHTPHAVDEQSQSGAVDGHDPTRQDRPPFEGTPARRGAGSASSRGSGAGAAAPRRDLQCPVCASRMDLERIGRIEIDRCPDCGGIFLDRGELQQLIGRDPSSYVPDAPEAERDFLIYTPHGLSDHIRES